MFVQLLAARRGTTVRGTVRGGGGLWGDVSLLVARNAKDVSATGKRRGSTRLEQVDLMGAYLKSDRQGNSRRVYIMGAVEERLVLPSTALAQEWHAALFDLIGCAPASAGGSHVIDEADLTIEGRIGRGGFGVVKRGTWLGSVQVAVKTINQLPEFTSEADRAEFYHEIDLLSELRHPNVVSFFGVCTFSTQETCLVTEFVAGGDLSTHIRGNTLSLRQKFHVIAEIAAGMIYLHRQNIVHRDLKPANLLVVNWKDVLECSGNVIKVCDFGLSQLQGEGDEGETVISTPAYQAPELMTVGHGPEVDVYSLAVIMWELDTGREPWAEIEDPLHILSGVARGNRLPDSVVQSELRSVMKSAWASPAVARWDMMRIFQAASDQVKLLPPDSVAPSAAAAGGVAGGGAGRPAYAAAAAAGAAAAGGAPPAALTTAASIAEQAKTWFGTQLELSGRSFAMSLAAASGASPQECASICHILQPDARAVVARDKWDQFVAHVAPLMPESAPGDGTGRNGGFKISALAQWFGAAYFYGFETSDGARHMLDGKSEGTFLMRFSSSPGCYAISASHCGRVVHWRVVLKGGRLGIDSEDFYSSFEDICRRNAPSATSGGLKIHGAPPGENRAFLDTPLARPPDVITVVTAAPVSDAAYGNVGAAAVSDGNDVYASYSGGA